MNAQFLFEKFCPVEVTITDWCIVLALISFGLFLIFLDQFLKHRAKKIK